MSIIKSSADSIIPKTAEIVNRRRKKITEAQKKKCEDVAHNGMLHRNFHGIRKFLSYVETFSGICGVIYGERMENVKFMALWFECKSEEHIRKG